MVRLVRHLVLAAAGVLLATVLTPALAQPAPARAAGAAPGAPARAPGGPTQAAPKAPAGVDITGPLLAEPLRLRAATHPAEVVAVIDQVNWLSRAGLATGPQPTELGPKYTIVVLAGDVPVQTYDLYPLATGGPRVYRPAKQPDPAYRPKAGWFLGRLNMSEALRAAGVPLEGRRSPASGGIGGGERVLPEESPKPPADLGEAFGKLRRLLLLNAGLMVVITVGLGGIALVIRRRTR